VKIDPAIVAPGAAKLTHRSWDAAIAQLAGGQHGVVGRQQLLGLGMTRHDISARIKHGSLHRYHHGVYVVGARRIGRRGRWMAAVLAGGPGAVLSHRAAACLWGVLPPSFDRPEVTVPSGRRARRPGITCHAADFAADEVTEIDGIPVTSIFRTLFDLVGDLRARDLERAWKETAIKRLTDRVPTAALLDRHPGKRGAAAIRRLGTSTMPIPVTRNDFEERFLVVLDANNLPRPRFNPDLYVRDQFFKPDCLWEREKLIVELDGGEVHNTDHAFQADRRRDRILLAEGYRTTRVTWHQLRDEPAEVVADLRSSLALYP
jgi:very-short-patch-repair endonuclease